MIIRTTKNLCDIRSTMKIRCRHKITLSLILSLPIKSRDGVVCKVFSELRTIDAFRTDSIIADWGCAKSYYKVIVEKLLTIQAPIQNRRAKRTISASLLWNFVSSISGSVLQAYFLTNFPVLVKVCSNIILSSFPPEFYFKYPQLTCKLHTCAWHQSLYCDSARGDFWA